MQQPIQPPPGLFQQDKQLNKISSGPPPGLNLPPGLVQQQNNNHKMIGGQNYKQNSPQMLINPYFGQVIPTLQLNSPFGFINTLESLDIDIKATKEELDGKQNKNDFDQKLDIKFNQMMVSTDGNEEYCYLEPRMNNLVITSEGAIFDVLENDMVALWDKNFKLLKYHKGLLDNKVAGFQLIALSDNKLLKIEQSIISILDINNGKNIDVWDCNINMHCADVTKHNPPRLVTVGDGQFCVWILKSMITQGCDDAIVNTTAFNIDSPVIKSSNDLDLVRVSKTRFIFCDSLLVLDNGVVLAKQCQEGEVFQVNLDTQEVQQLNSTQGSTIYDWAKLSWNQAALSENGNIFIVEFKGNKEQLIQTIKTSNDICQMKSLQDEKLATVSTRGEIRIWDRRYGKLLKYFSNELVKNRSHFYLYSIDQNTLMTFSNDEKFLSVFQLQFYEQQILVKNTINFKSRLRMVQLCRLSPCGNYIMLVQESGTFTGGQVDITPEIEIFCLNTQAQNSIQHKKQIGDGSLVSGCFTLGSVEIEFQSSDNDDKEQNTLHKQICVQYIIIPRKTQSRPKLVQWFFTHNVTLSVEIIEQFSQCIIYSFNRMIFSYSYDRVLDINQSKSNEGFNMFAPTPLKQSLQTVQQKYSGLSVYDTDQRLFLRVNFEIPYLVKIFDMPNDTHLYFINNKQQIEVWNIITQTLIQKADCRPSVIQQIKFQNEPNHLVFLNGTGELILRNQKLGLICKRKTETKLIYKRIEFIDDDRLLLLHNRKLELWNFRENKIEQLNTDFNLNDFIFIKQFKIILMVGDYCMKRIIVI